MHDGLSNECRIYKCIYIPLQEKYGLKSNKVVLSLCNRQFKYGIAKSGKNKKREKSLFLIWARFACYLSLFPHSRSH